MHRVEKFKVAYGELVKPYVLILVEARDRGDMPDVVMLGEVEVVECCTGSNGTKPYAVDSKPFQARNLEMRQQFFARSILVVCPLLEFVNVKPCAKIFCKLMVEGAFDQNLLGVKIGQQLIDVFVSALGSVKFAR